MRERGGIGSACLLLMAALIWGGSFVAQSVGLDYLHPFAINGLRMLLGALALLPVAAWMRHRRPAAADSANRRRLLRAGLICGVLLFLACTLQQFALRTISAGKAAFETALYVVLVPVFGLFLGRRSGPFVWISVLLAVVGLYFLCLTERFTLGAGDVLTLCCALGFAGHILAVDHYLPELDDAAGVMLSSLQFFVAGGLSILCMLATEIPTWKQIVDCRYPLLYSGLLSCGAAYTFQILGQRRTSPSVASLLLSFESVFAALSGWLLLGQSLSVREAIGCALMFLAVVLAQLPAPGAASIEGHAEKN